jgi:flagellar biogenesis protein FliO
MKHLPLVLRQKKGIIGLAAILLCFLVLSIWSHGTAQGTAQGTADDQASPGTGTPQPMPSLGGAVFKVVSSVALVIGVLYVGVYLTRVLSRKVGSGSLRPDAISVIHKRHIAPKKAIYVVTIGSRAMVVGVTDSQISHLADLSQEEVESIRVTDAGTAKQFKKHLLAFGFGIEQKPKGTQS